MPPSLPTRFARATAGNASSSSGSNVHACAVVQSSGTPDPGDAVRPVEAEGDRQPHVGRRRLGDRRSVDELDHRVDDRLRMHDDLDAVVRHVEQQVRLDHLEALVDECRRVRRDHEPHVPGRMRERLRRRHVAERFAGAPAERTAGCREHQAATPPPPYPTAAPARSRSAPSRPARSARGARCGVTRAPPDDEGLFVREREGAPGLERGERRAETDRSGDAVQHDVGVDGANEPFGVVGTEGGVCDTELARLLVEQIGVPAGRETDDGEPVTVRPDDVEGLRSDGAGRAENHYPAHRAMLRASSWSSRCRSRTPWCRCP